MKIGVLFTILLLPLTATAQKLVASHPAVIYHVGAEKAPLYRAIADTARKTGYYLSPDADASVVGEFSPKWLVVKRQGFLYLTPTKLLSQPNSVVTASLAQNRIKELQARIDVDDAARKAGRVALDTKNGFRAYRFGESISNYPMLKQQTSKGRKLQYVDPNESMHIGEAELKSVTYFFYKGKLTSVMLETDGIINSKRVMEALESQYGEPSKPNDYIKSYYWLGKEVELTYDENSINHDATIIFRNRALKAQEDADDREVAKKAASDL